jgi:multidrug efflux pump subunit AcrA (membrane-fusion protein)
MDSGTSATAPDAERRLGLFQYAFRHSRSQVAPQQFYQAFVSVLLEVFRGDAVCVWMAQSGKLRPTTAAKFEATGLSPQASSWEPHERLIESVAVKGAPVGIGPRETTLLGVNPLPFELLLVPIVSGSAVVGLVEIFRSVPADITDAATQTEASSIELAELRQWCEFLPDYVRSREVSTLAGQTETEAAVRRFVMRLHGAQTKQEVALIAVNEGRQAIGCERVSLGWANGRRPKLLSASGLDSINERSNVVQTLTRLTKIAVQTGEGLNHLFGPKPATASASSTTVTATAQEPRSNEAASERPLPAGYRSVLDAYPVEERPQQLLVVPLSEPSRNRNGKPRCPGALIVEQFRSEGLGAAEVQRATIVAEQVRIALQRTELLDSIPLLSWWRRAARTTWLARLRQLVVLSIVGAAITALIVVPTELRVAADGELLCEVRRTVFAMEDGIVREILVHHGDVLKGGERTVVLDNLDLASRLRELTGQLTQTRERRRSLEASRLGQRLTERDQLALQSALAEAAVTVEHLEQQINRMQERLDRLVTLAPEAGVVTNWNLEQTLLHRPVRQGDALFQQIDPDGGWIVELNIPEDRSGYVARRLGELPDHEKLLVDFVLASDPETRFQGTLRELASRTELTSSGHTVRAIVDLDRSKPPPLRDGTEVHARLHCGPRSVGFVVFREVIEVIYTYWWF